MANGRQINRRQFLKVGGGVLALGVTADLLAACGGNGGSAGTTQGAGGTLTIGIAADPETLDPEWGQAARANETLKNIYSQWVKYEIVDSGQGYQQADLPNVQGEAIESFTVDPDGTTVTFRVRDAKFPDGRPITADDFIYKVERSFGMQAGSIFVFNTLGLTDPANVTKVSDREFTFKLDFPSPILGPLLRDQDIGLVDTEMVKQNASADDPWAGEWLARNAAPTGAYIVSSFDPGRSLVLEANPSYWRSKPYFTTINLQIIPSPDDRVLLLRDGTLDMAQDLSIDAATRLQDVEGVNVLSAPTTNQNVLGFVVDKPPFDDVRVRQAIAYGLPYESLVADVLQGEALVAKGVWPQNSIWFEDVPWPYTQDPGQAQALLEQAGQAGGLTFTVEIREGDADSEALAVPIQTALREIGVTMNISKLAAAQFQEHLTERSMEAWIQSNLGSYVDDPYYECFLWFATDAVINWFNYSNPTVDRLNEALKTELDADRRRQLGADLQTQLNQDVPRICLGEPNFLLPVRDGIDGFLLEPDRLLTYSQFKEA